MSVITKLPLQHLATPHGDATRIGDVGSGAIRNLWREGPVRFVVADVGEALHWIPEADCFDVWKKEVQPHLAEPGQRVYLEQYADGYAYFASQWDDGRSAIIVLSKTH